MTYLQLSTRLGFDSGGSTHPAVAARRIWDAWVRSRAFRLTTTTLAAEDNRLDAFSRMADISIEQARGLVPELRAVERELNGLPKN